MGPTSQVIQTALSESAATTADVQNHSDKPSGLLTKLLKLNIRIIAAIHHGNTASRLPCGKYLHKVTQKGQQVHAISQTPDGEGKATDHKKAFTQIRIMS